MTEEILVKLETHITTIQIMCRHLINLSNTTCCLHLSGDAHLVILQQSVMSEEILPS